MALELRYFNVMAKGLGPALVLEYSGLEWRGSKDLGFHGGLWQDLKPKTPFGQLPLLTLPTGEMIAQTTAIINYIGKTAGTEGSGSSYATSQMLLGEAEDLYALMQKFVPTIYVAIDKKLGVEAYNDFWLKTAHEHLEKINRLSGHDFLGTTLPGALYLFSILHQMVLACPKAGGLWGVIDEFRGLRQWYQEILDAPQTQKVESILPCYNPTQLPNSPHRL
jgi:glutathione S-transferase